ncbi:MAG: MFS transporter [Alphaproteobacteria bacterium]
MQSSRRTDSSFYPWFIWSFAGLFYLYQFVLRASPNVMADQLMRDFSIDAYSFGILAACYYYTYSLFQIPVGLMLDSIGPKRVLRVAVGLCALGALVFSAAPNLWFAALGRTLIGAGASCAFLGTVRLGTLWFPPERLAFVVGVSVALGKVGGMSANLPLAILVENFSWRQATLILSLAGLVIWLLVWIFVKDGPSDRLPPRPTTGSMWESTVPTLSLIVKSPAIWWISLYGCLMYVPLSAFTDAWGTSFLMKLHNIDKPTASGVISMLFVGTGIGAPLIAFFSDYLRGRQFPMVISAIFSLLANGALIFIPDLSLETSIVLLFLIGFFMTGQTLVFVAASEATPPHMSGTVTGFVNMIVMTGGAILQPLIGYLLNWSWDGKMENCFPSYSVSDFRLALSTIPLCMLLSLVAVAFVPETHPNRRNKAQKPAIKSKEAE